MIQSISNEWRDYTRRLVDSGTQQDLVRLIGAVELVGARLDRMCQAAVTHATLRVAVREMLPRSLTEEIRLQVGEQLEEEALVDLRADFNGFRDQVKDLEESVGTAMSQPFENLSQLTELLETIRSQMPDRVQLESLAARLERMEQGVQRLAEQIDHFSTIALSGDFSNPPREGANGDETGNAIVPSLDAPINLPDEGFDFRIDELEQRFRVRLARWEDEQSKERDRLCSLRDQLSGQASSIGNRVDDTTLWRRLTGNREGRLKESFSNTLVDAIRELDQVIAHMPRPRPAPDADVIEGDSAPVVAEVVSGQEDRTLPNSDQA